MLKFYSSPADKDSEYYVIADLLARGYNATSAGDVSWTGLNEQALTVDRCALFQIIRED